jgi:hypothetical protein
MRQQKAISVDAKRNNRREAEEALLAMAEKELSAFARAVKDCFGPGEARHGFDCWMQELEAIDWPISGTTPDWRRVTIAAATRLAPRLMPRHREKRRMKTGRASQAPQENQSESI